MAIEEAVPIINRLEITYVEPSEQGDITIHHVFDADKIMNFTLLAGDNEPVKMALVPVNMLAIMAYCTRVVIQEMGSEEEQGTEILEFLDSLV